MPWDLSPGSPVVLEEPDGDYHLVRVPGLEDTVEVPGVGVLSGSLFEDVRMGERISLGRRWVRALRVTPELAFKTLERGPQVIRPKDASRIAHACGVGPGSTVVEGGVGSGALTTYVAFLVGPEGSVHGFDVRDKHLSIARSNLERLDLGDRVSWHGRSLAECEVSCDAFLVDVPGAEEVLPAAEACLDTGGCLSVYTPLVSQMEAVHEALSGLAFARVRTVELLSRSWAVHDRGARPSFDMLGHTGFLTFATRVAED